MIQVKKCHTWKGKKSERKKKRMLYLGINVNGKRKLGVQTYIGRYILLDSGPEVHPEPILLDPGRPTRLWPRGTPRTYPTTFLMKKAFWFYSRNVVEEVMDPNDILAPSKERHYSAGKFILLSIIYIN